MPSCDLNILDEINVRFDGLDTDTRRLCKQALEVFNPAARFSKAYKLGQWNGKVGYFDLGGHTYINVLDRVIPILEKKNYDINIIDSRKNWNFKFDDIDENFLADKCWPKGHRFEGQPIILNEHQVCAVNNMLGNTQCLIEAATSAGKTAICAALARKVSQYGRIIMVVPNVDLITQTYALFNDVLGIDTGVFHGTKKELHHHATICTWQSINCLDKRTKQPKAKKVVTANLKKSKKPPSAKALAKMELSELEVDTFLKDVVAVICDEAHTLSGAVLQYLMSNPFKNVPIRWGMSGTIPKNKDEFIPLLISTGHVKYRITANELQKKEILSNCHIKVLSLKDDTVFQKTDDDEFGYHTEMQYLEGHRLRNRYIALLVRAIASTGNTLLLLNRIAMGKEITNYLTDLDAVFIHGAVDTSVRKDEYDDVNVSENKVLIATYGVAAVGLDIPRIKNLILVDAGTSFRRVIQSIGRGLRKSYDKDFVDICDIHSTTRHSLKQMKTRIKFYKEAKYPYEIITIPDWEESVIDLKK